MSIDNQLLSRLRREPAPSGEGHGERQELRRRPRIAFQGRIRLKAPGREATVDANVQNLTILGAFVTTAPADAPGAGSEVLCRFNIANEGRLVRGRVVWMRYLAADGSQPSAGLGIEFLGVDPQAMDLLRRLTEPSPEVRRPVDVWFDGMRSSVRCQAVVTGRSVRLVTQLPFMRPGSPARLAFTDQPARGIYEGTVGSVMLTSCDDEGIPRLRLNVSLAGQSNVRGTIEVATPAKPLAEEPAPVASVVVSPALTAPPPPTWLTVEHDRPADSATKADTTGDEPAASEGALELRPGRWLTQGWWPMALGGVVGAVLVSALLLLLRR
jgi:PilZ domain